MSHCHHPAGLQAEADDRPGFPYENEAQPYCVWGSGQHEAAMPPV